MGIYISLELQGSKYRPEVHYYEKGFLIFRLESKKKTLAQKQTFCIQEILKLRNVFHRFQVNLTYETS